MADDRDQLESSDFSSSDMRIHVGDDGSDMLVNVDDDISGMESIWMQTMRWNPYPYHHWMRLSVTSLNLLTGQFAVSFVNCQSSSCTFMSACMRTSSRRNTTEAGYTMLRSSHLMEPLRAALRRFKK